MRLFKRISTVVLLGAVLLAGGRAYAQDPSTREEYSTRYNYMLSRVGAAGVGMEALLNKWEAAFPDDSEMCLAKFSYYYLKCRTSSTITRSESKYLGNDPILALKDTLGNPVNYFEDYIYDDEMFGQATTYLDKAIAVNPDHLEMRLIKATALSEYEKESPDMTLSFLKALVDYNYQGKPKWSYPDYDSVDDEDFVAFMQQYCHLFYGLGSDAGWEAFKSLSEKMLQFKAKDPMFLTNIGTYHFAFKKDNKTALKYYKQVLKIQPDSYPAIKNCVLLARAKKDVKLEKKYLPMLIKYTDSEAEKAQAQARLSAL